MPGIKGADLFLDRAYLLRANQGEISHAILISLQSNRVLDKAVVATTGAVSWKS